MASAATGSDVTIDVNQSSDRKLQFVSRTLSSDSSDATFDTRQTPTVTYGGDKTAKYLDDPQSYFASLETEDNIKCVISSFLFVVIVVALLFIMFIYNPQM